MLVEPEEDLIIRFRSEGMKLEVVSQNKPPVHCPATGATCSLDCLEAGKCGKVLSVNGDGEFRRRLLEMGFCNGAAVEMIRRAPFGDPIEFRLRGYCLSLRHEQARNIMVSIDRKGQK